MEWDGGSRQLKQKPFGADTYTIRGRANKRPCRSSLHFIFLVSVCHFALPPSCDLVNLREWSVVSHAPCRLTAYILLQVILSHFPLDTVFFLVHRHPMMHVYICTSQAMVPIMKAVGKTCTAVSRLVRRAQVDGMAGLHQEASASTDGGGEAAAESVNVQGEVQKELDVLSNSIFLTGLCQPASMSCVASEEEETPRMCAAVVGEQMHGCVRASFIYERAKLVRPVYVAVARGGRAAARRVGTG